MLFIPRQRRHCPVDNVSLRASVCKELQLILDMQLLPRAPFRQALSHKHHMSIYCNVCACLSPRGLIVLIMFFLYMHVCRHRHHQKHVIIGIDLTQTSKHGCKSLTCTDEQKTDPKKHVSMLPLLHTALFRKSSVHVTLELRSAWLGQAQYGFSDEVEPPPGGSLRGSVNRRLVDTAAGMTGGIMISRDARRRPWT